MDYDWFSPWKHVVPRMILQRILMTGRRPVKRAPSRGMTGWSVMSFRWTVSMARLFVTKIGPQVSMQVQWGSGMTKLIWRMGEGPPRSRKLGNQTINTFDESLKPKHFGPWSRWACTKHQADGLDEECLIRRIWVIGPQIFLVNIKPFWRNLRSTRLRCCPCEINI